VDGNVHVDSDHNTLIDVMAESVISAAFAIAGHHNLLTNSIALCPQVESCIFVGGDGNRVIDNFVRAESDSRALVVTGDNNVVQGNRLILTGFLLHGLIVSGTGNRLTGNTAITEDGVDLVDVNGDCAHNTWRHNIFVTREPACIK
jgi:hypothetical protein